MNINVNIPIELVERIAEALERLAVATEWIAGPRVQEFDRKPYPVEMWGSSSNAQSRQIEEEERREAAGFGPSYERDLEARAGIARIDSADSLKG